MFSRKSNDNNASITVATTLKTMFTPPDEQECKFSVVEPIPEQPDLAEQLWPLEAQRKQQYEMALQYDELCKTLQTKLRVDHESRAGQIRERLKKKLISMKKNQTLK